MKNLIKHNLPLKMNVNDADFAYRRLEICNKQIYIFMFIMNILIHLFQHITSSLGVLIDIHNSTNYIMISLFFGFVMYYYLTINYLMHKYHRFEYKRHKTALLWMFVGMLSGITVNLYDSILKDTNPGRNGLEESNY